MSYLPNEAEIDIEDFNVLHVKAYIASSIESIFSHTTGLYFSESNDTLIVGLLGSTPAHLFAFTKTRDGWEFAHCGEVSLVSYEQIFECIKTVVQEYASWEFSVYILNTYACVA